MSKGAYPNIPAVPTWSNQPVAGVIGQPHRSMGGYPPGQSADISQQRQTVLRPPSSSGSNFPEAPSSIPQTMAGPPLLTAVDITTATVAVQQMQLDKQSGA